MTVSAGQAREFTPTCSVVVCTRDRPALLDRCLDALSRVVYPSVEVLVVDNAPTDGRTRDVANRHGVRYVVEPVPGLSRARNRGARACTSEVIAFVDDDALPERDWVGGLAREFEDPTVMAAAGRILPLSRETEAERLFGSLGGSGPHGEERMAIDRQTRSWFQLAALGGIGIGANMAVRSSAFELWPGFDERLGRGGILKVAEDHFAFFTLIDRGYRVVYTPHAVVRHPDPRTMEALRQRFLSDLAGGTGYLTLLFFEARAHRRSILRYAAEGLVGTRRSWRGQMMKGQEIVPRWRWLLAILTGPWLFLRAQLAGRRERRSS